MPTAELSIRAARLRAVGLKATGPRLAILGELERDPGHPTAEAVFARLRSAHPSLSLSTVYETLQAFLRAGLCRRVPGLSGKLRVDGTSEDHDHALCRGCGKIFDVPRRGVPVDGIGARLPEGLTLKAVRLEYEVLCRACDRAEARSAGLRPKHS